ncbi:hypothetical protein B7463_g2359, partial [Scytalidium lignicola]
MPEEYLPGKHIIPPPLPPQAATAGWKINHLMLRITDPEASLRFYNECFGLHTIFIFNTGTWTIYYLGPRDASIATLGTSQGLIELYHIPGGPERYRNGNEEGGMQGGFGHIGFTVPDVEKALERVRGFGYEVIKPLGEAKGEQYGVPDFLDATKVDEGYNHVFRQLAFVKDPDGYWVELVPEVVKPPSNNAQESKGVL